MMRQRLTAVWGVVLGLLFLAGTSRGDEAAAVRAIEKLGGKVTVLGTDFSGKPFVKVVLSYTKVTDAGLKELKEITNLQLLSLAGTQVTDAGLKELKDLKTLIGLNLIGTQVTDAGLKELTNLTSLQTLYLSFTQVTDAGVKELKMALPMLK